VAHRAHKLTPASCQDSWLHNDTRERIRHILSSEVPSLRKLLCRAKCYVAAILQPSRGNHSQYHRVVMWKQITEI